MQIGVVFPQTEIGVDPDGVREYVRAVERLGFRHLLAYDHVLGADPEVYAPWRGAYDVDTQFHEPFMLFAHLAGLCSLELVTGVLVAPQRQTALLAKQAAELDLLAGGDRFRLGLGIGWNRVEFEALGQDTFRRRGRRLDEQIELLRLLWSQRSVHFEGEFDRVVGAGINPRPERGDIPIWLGARSAPAYARVGRLADGWFPLSPPGPDLDAALAQIAEAAETAGRDPSAIGMEGRLEVAEGLDKLAGSAAAWRATGATHVTVGTMRAGRRGASEHIELLAEIADQLA